jgi:hypothetical protein
MSAVRAFFVLPSLATNKAVAAKAIMRKARIIIPPIRSRVAKLTGKHYTIDMAKGPRGEKRPADVNARAVMIARIATGEIEDVTTDDGKNAAAVALGRMGGKARAKGMSAKRRAEIARKAADKRWSK